MTLDPAILTRLAVSVDVTDYVRIIARAHAATWVWVLVDPASPVQGTGFTCYTWRRIP